MEGVEKDRATEKPNRDDVHEQREDDQEREGVTEGPPAGDPPLPPDRQDKAPGKPHAKP